MARPAAGEQVLVRIREYLASAQESPQQTAPISVLAVSRATGFHRNTIKKYGLADEIGRAAEVQRRFARSTTHRAKAEHSDTLAKRDEEIRVLRQRTEALVGRIALAEGNAQRLGIDPAELWKPLTAPPRDTPHSPS